MDAFALAGNRHRPRTGDETMVQAQRVKEQQKGENGFFSSLLRFFMLQSGSRLMERVKALVANKLLRRQ
jgi:hypothetical protein